jgi:integrase
MAHHVVFRKLYASCLCIVQRRAIPQRARRSAGGLKINGENYSRSCSALHELDHVEFRIMRSRKRWSCCPPSPEAPAVPRLLAPLHMILRRFFSLASRPTGETIDQLPFHPGLKGKRITPHLVRHSTATHLLQSGVDISVIALWLGHESIETTHMYIEADLATKERALAKLAPADGTVPRFKATDSVLAFLDSL